ncbi:MAG: Txe/YoeB family addiction module toxin [Candidatus Kapaibacterium sp.]|nr:MAG: Txe/YoeB family addiction module toxin [Candidatus Kapabacteria bacterium]
MKSVQFDPIAMQDFIEWATVDKKIFDKIARLLGEVQRTPFTGIGKPEPLKHALQGCWSRRITNDHRFVYRVQGEVVVILGCKNHYE